MIISLEEPCVGVEISFVLIVILCFADDSHSHSWWLDIVEYVCMYMSSTMMTSVMQPTLLIDDQL